jgi:hypothetical protein
MSNVTKTVHLRELMAVAHDLVVLLVGVAFVVSFLGNLYATYQYLGDSSKLTEAKELLKLHGGYLAIVLAYFYGRAPAEAARKDAAEAQRALTQVKARTSATISRASAALQHLPDTALPRGGSIPSLVQELRELEQQLTS